MLDVIDHFRNEYAFLSNFYRRKILYRGHWFPSSEHAYHAEKSLDERYRTQLMVQKEIDKWNKKMENKEYVCLMPELNPKESKDYGSWNRLIQKGLHRLDWFDMSLETMYNININKFTQNPDLAKKLISTEGKVLIEGNYWGDDFWGMIKSKPKDPNSEWKGKNHLGKTLMRVREAVSGFDGMTRYAGLCEYQSPCPKCGSVNIRDEYVNCKCHVTNEDGTLPTCWSHPICEECGLVGYANSEGSYWGDKYKNLWKIKNK